MTSPEDMRREFSRLIFAALESPASVDRNDLLTAASLFLDAAQGGDPTGLRLARHMGYKAMDWCVVGDPRDYRALARAAECFSMCSQINTATGWT
jgi:hypothetical protein